MTWWKSVYGDERDTVFRYVTFRSATHHDPVTYFLSPPPVLLDVCGHGSKHVHNLDARLDQSRQLLWTELWL